MKVVGYEIKKFWNDASFKFPKGEVEWDMDEWEPVEIDELEDNIKYELKELGYFNYIDHDSSITFESAFKLWKKQQTVTTLVIEVSNENVDNVIALLKQHNITVTK